MTTSNLNCPVCGEPCYIAGVDFQNPVHPYKDEVLCEKRQYIEDQVHGSSYLVIAWGVHRGSR